MYVWIWRHLPGGFVGKLAGSLVLLGGAVALLFFVVFPWVEPRLPFNHVTVQGSLPPVSTPSATTPGAGVSAPPAPAPGSPPASGPPSPTP